MYNLCYTIGAVTPRSYDDDDDDGDDVKAVVLMHGVSCHE